MGPMDFRSQLPSSAPTVTVFPEVMTGPATLQGAGLNATLALVSQTLYLLNFHALLCRQMSDHMVYWHLLPAVKATTATRSPAHNNLSANRTLLLSPFLHLVLIP